MVLGEMVELGEDVIVEYDCIGWFVVCLDVF